MKDKIKTLEIELDEERSSLELLNDRISRSRDQVSCERAVTANKKEASQHDGRRGNKCSRPV